MIVTVPESKVGRRSGLRERLLGRAIINQDTGCWEWTGVKTSRGYASVMVNYVQHTAHRVSYEMLVGPIPTGLVLDHLCRVRHCINPAHLEPVTVRENTLRSPIRGTETECCRGHDLTGANLYISRKGKRACRECQRQRQRGLRAAARLEVSA